ncbi:hypothetical protein [Actinophytocola sp.]|uniref:hypothetical protein n=1 Tax=Actinophytocola sp. TaxID=1872138 RepID=UPI003899D544
MRQEHPDDRFMLTGEERSQFREIWRELADEGPDTLDAGSADAQASRLAWSAVLVACGLLVFVGLAVDSVFLVLLASGGALGARRARRRLAVTTNDAS